MIRSGKNLMLKLFIRSIQISFLQQKDINNFSLITLEAIMYHKLGACFNFRTLIYDNDD